jgi:hypothetical protein
MRAVNSDDIRNEPREESPRSVEYARFPRISPGQRPRIGFTRDVSEAGMCLGTDDAEPIGSLLRVTVRSLDGRPRSPSIHRVVSCSTERNGRRYWLGLEFVSERQERWSSELRTTTAKRDAANA